MGKEYKKTGGRCGACLNMGCIDIPGEYNNDIRKLQKYQYANTKLQKTFYFLLKQKIRIFFEKFFNE